MEIKNKLTVTRAGKGKGDNGEKKGKGCPGTCIKDSREKTTGRGRIEFGGWGWVGRGKVVGGKWGQL